MSIKRILRFCIHLHLYTPYIYLTLSEIIHVYWLHTILSSVLNYKLIYMPLDQWSPVNGITNDTSDSLPPLQCNLTSPNLTLHKQNLFPVMKLLSHPYTFSRTILIDKDDLHSWDLLDNYKDRQTLPLWIHESQAMSHNLQIHFDVNPLYYLYTRHISQTPCFI